MHSAPPRILIVEDDAVLVTDLQDTLIHMGYQVAGLAATGKAAVELALEQKPDAILMDIHLRGEMTGIQAAEEIHKQEDFPVVYLTAYSDEDLLQQAKISEAYAYLTKPVRGRELRASLEMALYKHSAEQRLQKQNLVLRALRSVNQLVMQEHSAEELMGKVCQTLLQTRGYRFVWIGQSAGDLLKPLASAGNGQDFLGRIVSTASPEQGRKLPGTQAARTHQVVFCQDMLQDERYAPWREEAEKAGFCSTVAVPILNKERLFGVLSVYAGQANSFDQEEIDLLVELAGDIAIGMRSITEEAERQQAEDALRESEARFRGLLQNVTAVSVQGYAMDGTTQYWNQASERLYGYTAQQALGRNLLDLIIPPEMHSGVKEAIQQMVETGQPIPPAELSLLRADGTRVSVYSSHAIVRAPGRPPELFCIDIDLSERKQAQEQLERSEKNYRNLFQVNKDGIAIFLINPEGQPGNFVEVNEAAPRMLGLTREEMLGRSPLMLEENLSEETVRFRQAELQTRGIVNFETVIRHKAGHSVYAEMTAQIIQYDGRMAVMNIVRDITERKLAEKQLRESEEKYRTLVDSSIQGVLLYQEQHLAYVNSRICEILGYSAEELARFFPLHASELIHPEDRQRVAERTRRFLSGEPVNDLDAYRVIRKDGQFRQVETFSKSLTLEGKQAGIVTVVDVTERKQREHELEVIAVLSAALRGVANRAQMLPVIVEQIVSLVRCNSITIELIDPQTGDAVVEAAYGAWKPLLGTRQKNGTGINAIISATRQPYHTHNLENDSNLTYHEWAREGVRGSAGVPLIAQEQLIGFIWMGRSTDISEVEVRSLVALSDITANALHRATLNEKVQQDAANLAQAYDTTLAGWARALELRDQETEGHGRRIVQLTMDFAHSLGINGYEMENIRRGVLLHDIGKMGIPDSVLLKPGTLNEREWEIMRRHPEYAYDLLNSIEYLRPALDIPYCHHEKWDGTGYPRGLKGQEIPLTARLFAIADVWDALTNDRPYRKAWSKEQTIKYIREQSGKHFDPQMVAAFLELIANK